MPVSFPNKTINIRDRIHPVFNIRTSKNISLLTDPDASNYIGRTNIQNIDNKQKLDKFIKGLKQYNLWLKLVDGWISMSSYNIGFGSNLYALKNNSNNMILVASPIWGTTGITLDGTSQYIYTTTIDPQQLGLNSGFSLFTVFNADATASNACTYFGSRGGTATTNVGTINAQATVANGCNGVCRFSGGVATAASSATYLGTFNSFGVSYITKSAIVDIYRNGKNKVRTTGSGTYDAVYNSNVTQKIAIGATIGANNAAAAFAKATYSFSCIFNIPLSDLEHFLLYNLIRNTIGSELGLS